MPSICFGVNEAGLVMATFLASARFSRCPIGYLEVRQKTRDFIRAGPCARYPPPPDLSPTIVICDFEVKHADVAGYLAQQLRQRYPGADLYFAVFGAMTTAAPAGPDFDDLTGAGIMTERRVQGGVHRRDDEPAGHRASAGTSMTMAEARRAHGRPGFIAGPGGRSGGRPHGDGGASGRSWSSGAVRRRRRARNTRHAGNFLSSHDLWAHRPVPAAAHPAAARGFVYASEEADPEVIGE